VATVALLRSRSNCLLERSYGDVWHVDAALDVHGDHTALRVH
jgi:hypothetical protein